jgi:hypothetical protein
MLIFALLMVLSFVVLVAAYFLGMHAASTRIREKTSEVFHLALPRRTSNGRAPLMLGAESKFESADESSRLTSSAFFPMR